MNRVYYVEDKRQPDKPWRCTTHWGRSRDSLSGFGDVCGQV